MWEPKKCLCHDWAKINQSERQQNLKVAKTTIWFIFIYLFFLNEGMQRPQETAKVDDDRIVSLLTKAAFQHLTSLGGISITVKVYNQKMTSQM